MTHAKRKRRTARPRITSIFQHHKCGIQDPHEGCPDPRCEYFALVEPTAADMREAMKDLSRLKQGASRGR